MLKGLTEVAAGLKATQNLFLLMVGTRNRLGWNLKIPSPSRLGRFNMILWEVAISRHPHLPSSGIATCFAVSWEDVSLESLFWFHGN